ncbi:MAG: excalibur calcium-binding domain-containing protein [Ancrocorticia sp.]
MPRPNLGSFSRKARKKASVHQTIEIPMEDPAPSTAPLPRHLNFFNANKWRILRGAGLVLVGIVIGTSGGNSPADSTEYKELDASYNAVQSDLKSVKTSIAQLEQDIEKKDSTIKELEASKKTLEAERSKWIDQSASAKEKESKIAELDGKIATLTSERDTCQASLASTSAAAGSSTTTSEESSESNSSTPQGFVDPAPEPAQNVYYKNCSEVRAAGAAPLYAGDPGYAKHLDGDGDGIACEKK